MKINGLSIEPRTDLHGANLCWANLRGANLRGANMREANLRWANLRGANLRGAYMRGANLRGANLRGADLGGAELREVNLASHNVIDGGQDSRGYRFVMVPHDDGPRVLAGCRWFTLPEARAHWAIGSTVSPNAPECLRRVEMMAAEARSRDWPAPEGGW